MAATQVVGRLAPSPTGCLHLGHALSFLAAFWSAKSVDGILRLRLDDIDGDRSSQHHVEAAIFDLNWLGIEWDGAPMVESKRLEYYHSAAESLLVSGHAYPCTCTRGDLRRYNREGAQEIVGAPHAGTLEARYPGHCRNRFVSLSAAESHDGRPAGLRLRVPDKKVQFTDKVYGERFVDVQNEVGDFLILRRDKSPAYQLSVVLADALDGVNEIVRGRDLLESTARQLLVARALKLPSPETTHLPLVCDHAGRRLAKREGGLSLREMREMGVAPEQIVGWVAQSLGQSASGEPRPAYSILSAFDARLIPQEDILLPPEPISLFRKTGSPQLRQT